MTATPRSTAIKVAGCNVIFFTHSSSSKTIADRHQARASASAHIHFSKDFPERFFPKLHRTHGPCGDGRTRTTMAREPGTLSAKKYRV